jgi:hypothetical protein
VLGTTVWFVAVIGLLALTLMDGAAAFGRAGVHAAADHAIEAALHDAVADYQNQLQAAGEHSNAPPQPLSRTFAPQTAGNTAERGFTLAYTVTPTTLTAPACPQDAAVPSSGPDTVAWLQCGGFVRESRMSLRVVVRVLDAAGAQTLAQREQLVTLRLFGEPPYSAVAGRTDASANDPSGSSLSGADASANAVSTPAHEGDVGGAAPGTLIHVRYECHDGAGRCANAAPPDPDAGLRPRTQWANGNRPGL